MLNAPKSWAAARPDHFDSPGLSSQVAVVYLRNDCVPWKSDFASLASEKNKIATCGGFRHRRAAHNDGSGTAFESPWRNSGRKISLALNSGSSSYVFAASSGDGSVCAKEKFVAARRKDMIADSLFMVC